mmetsp:Transcript_5420/g.15516  ORF Transcript_5420/g.15516 Transcript_5420/m.15516 type:complete len:209 (+) Transcript_5420:302-928(+)
MLFETGECPRFLCHLRFEFDRLVFDVFRKCRLGSMKRTLVLPEIPEHAISRVMPRHVGAGAPTATKVVWHTVNMQRHSRAKSVLETLRPCLQLPLRASLEVAITKHRWERPHRIIWVLPTTHEVATHTPSCVCLSLLLRGLPNAKEMMRDVECERHCGSKLQLIALQHLFVTPTQDLHVRRDRGDLLHNLFKLRNNICFILGQGHRVV